MMKRILFGLFAWLLSAQLGLAAVTITNTATSSITISTGSTGSFGSLGTGTATADRVTLVAFSMAGLSGLGTTISSVTFNGGGVTCIGGASDTTYNSTIFCWLLNTSGTTTTVSVTTSATCSGTGCYVQASVYSITGANTITPISSTNIGTDVQNPNTSITVPSGGGMIAASGYIIGGATPNVMTWTNAVTSSQVDQSIGGAETGLAVGTSTSSGSYTVTGGWGTAMVFGSSTISVVAFQSSGGGATASPMRTLMGVGQ